MTVIDIGGGATDRLYSWDHPTYSVVEQDNPANDTGVLDTMEFWFKTSSTGLKCGTFSYVATGKCTYRAHANIGAVTAGSKQTFTGLSVAVTANDLLGYKIADGEMEWGPSSTVCWALTGDHFIAEGEKTYVTQGSYSSSMNATGATIDAQPFVRFYPHILAH